MKGTLLRLGRTFLTYGFRTLLLLFAVSVIAFALVELSPVDPVQQYILGAGGVSQEQRAELESARKVAQGRLGGGDVQARAEVDEVAIA